jgi:hypothetical protein
MDGTLIATTRNADLQTLGTGGQRAIHAWDQIVGYVGRTLGPEHAALFAEPNQDPDRGVTDWYAVGEGDVGILSALRGPEREAATATLARLHGDIRAASDRLRQSTREDERFLGEMLGLAVVTPGPDYVRVVGRQPILIAWGHTLVNAPMNPELLIGQVPLRTAMHSVRVGGPVGPMRIVGPPLPLASHLWKWVLGALLLACLLLFVPLLGLLLDPFHLFRAVAAQCVIAPGDVALLEELRTEAQRESGLRDQIARVALEMGNRRAACPPRVLPAPLPPPQPPSADVRRAEEIGARTGRMQIILAWDDVDDLDLVVICPSGEMIFFNGQSACGGTLDIDRNRSEVGATSTPVENVVFERAPASGQYRILVWKYAHRSQAPVRTPFRVTVRREGLPDRVSTGTVAPDEKVPVEPVVVAAPR